MYGLDCSALFFFLFLFFFQSSCLVELAGGRCGLCFLCMCGHNPRYDCLDSHVPTQGIVYEAKTGAIGHNRTRVNYGEPMQIGDIIGGTVLLELSVPISLLCVLVSHSLFESCSCRDGGGF